MKYKIFQKHLAQVVFSFRFHVKATFVHQTLTRKPSLLYEQLLYFKPLLYSEYSSDCHSKWSELTQLKINIYLHFGSGILPPV